MRRASAGGHACPGAEHARTRVQAPALCPRVRAHARAFQGVCAHQPWHVHACAHVCVRIGPGTCVGMQVCVLWGVHACTCVRVYMCVHVHVSQGPCTHIPCAYVSVPGTYIHVRICVCAQGHARTYACVPRGVQALMCVSVHACVHVCSYVGVHIRVCAYTHAQVRAYVRV